MVWAFLHNRTAACRAGSGDDRTFQSKAAAWLYPPSPAVYFNNDTQTARSINTLCLGPAWLLVFLAIATLFPSVCSSTAGVRLACLPACTSLVYLRHKVAAMLLLLLRLPNPS